MVFILLQKAEARVVIRHGRFALNLALGIDLKGQLGHAQLIALRSQHLAVGILAWNSRESRQIAVISGVILQHGLTVRALHLDQSVRQIIRAGQIRLGYAHIIVNQLIDHRHVQVDDDLIVLCAEIIADDQQVIRIAQLPALRTGQLPDIVFSMRELAFEADLPVFVGNRGCQQRISIEDTIRIGNGLTVIQAEDEAFAGNAGQGGMGHAILVRLGLQNLFLLQHADPGGQIIIDRNHADIDHRRHMISRFQNHIIAGTVEDIPCGS